MSNREDVFESKYLKAADLKGRPLIVEIEECWDEKLKARDGKESKKTILKFVGKDKKLPLNMTNWDSVADITGEDDTINWPGHKIEIYPTKTTMGGERVACIRVREPDGEASEAAQSPSPKARPSLKDELNDDIPM